MNSLLNVSSTGSFASVARENYKARITSIALDSDAYKTINNWVSKETNGLIRDFYTADEVNGKFILLMNALYFKGEFTDKFDKNQTVSKSFNTVDGKVKDVSMMNGLRNLPYMCSDKVQAISLGFGNGVFEMIVALPNIGTTLCDAAFEAMTLKSDAKTLVSVSIPKFREESEVRFEYVYDKLGINTQAANLSNITVNSVPLSCCILQTKQRTVFSVDENGAEGASVTGSGADVYMPCDTQFIADRPFVYMIREKTSGVILFMGAYVK